VANAVNEIAALYRMDRWKDRVQSISGGGGGADSARGCLKF
jgi:hypothetical protein